MPQINQKRIQILTPAEINEIYDLPTFNPTDREEYFSTMQQQKMKQYR